MRGFAITLQIFASFTGGRGEGVFDEDFTHLNGILYSLGAEDAGPLFELGTDTGAQDDARGAAISAVLPWADEDWEEWVADLDDLNPSLLVVPVDDARAALDCFSQATAAESDEIASARLAWLDRALWQGFGSAGAEQCIPLEVVDGFFTGVLSGPEPRPSFEGVCCQVCCRSWARCSAGRR